MIQRKAYIKLEKALNVKQIIAITGLRRVGKTTAVKYLLEKIPGKNKIYLDLEKIEYRRLFIGNAYQEVVRSLELEGIDFNGKPCIALDEIQLVPEIASVLKYLYDTYEIKFIVSGSSSYYMKGAFSESLAGRKRLFELWPLGFDDYLRFKGIDKPLPLFDFEPAPLHFVSLYGKHYNEYIQFGGFPEVALTFDPEDKKELLWDIFNSYVNFDIRFLADFSKTDELIKLVTILSSRAGNKIDYTKLSGITGINRHKVKDYLTFLENTYFIRLVKPFVTNPDREIALQKKLYFTDSGFLNIIGNSGPGILLENTIAHQLSLLGNVQYYTKRSGQEIDFILDGNTAIEVKETPTEQDLRTLKKRAYAIGIDKHFIAGRNIPGSGFADFVWGGAIY